MTENITSQAPAGWYEVEGQQERYWDGAGWSTQVRPLATQGIAGAEPPARVSGPARPWYSRWWVIALAGLLIGMVVGGASVGAADPRDSAEYKAVTQDLEKSREDVADRDQRLATSEDELEAAQAELEEVAGDIPAREKSVSAAEAALKRREAALKQREGDARRTAKALTRREKAVGMAEKEIAANTIAGEGLYEVGADMKPGTYKTSGMAGCYYGVLGDANGNNIKSNNLTDGPATVSVAAGEFFETSDCADWVLQR